MCTSNQNKPSNNNNNRNSGGTQGNMYPDLSQMFQGNQQAQAQQPIMHLLEALGLVPPGTATIPSAPPATTASATAPTESASVPTAPTESASVPTAPTESASPPTAQSNQGEQPSSGCENCQHCNPQRARPTASCWSAWTSAPNRAPYQQPPQCNFDFPRFLKNLGQILKTVFQCTTRVSSLVFMLVFIHLLTPVALLQNLVFMVIASGLGLHMPTLLAGQLLWAGVSCLKMFEPFFLAGLLIFSAHKVFVRKEPLIDQQFWRNRFANFRVNFNNTNAQN